MAGQEAPDGAPSSDPPPEDPWSVPPPPPAGWNRDAVTPALPPWAAPPRPPYGPAGEESPQAETDAPQPYTPQDEDSTGPSQPYMPQDEDGAGSSDAWRSPPPPYTPQAEAGSADPWRIPPQPPWDPSAGAPDSPAPGVYYAPSAREPARRPPTHPPVAPGRANLPAQPRAPRGEQPSTALDLPPSATAPRSTPRPPTDPRSTGANATVFDEPWRRETPVRQGSGVPLKPILIGVAGVVVAGLIAGGIVVFSGGGGYEKTDGPAAELAGGVFTADPAAKGDGRDQELLGVASAGSIVVAIGGEAGTADYRGEFLVSSDGGRSFRLADVRTPDGGEPGGGDTPRVVAGADGSWVALGGSHAGTAVWTSRDGKSWVRQPDAMGAAFGRDKITRVARTGSGFVAVGDTSQKGDYSDAVPVVWLSEDGRHWERLGNDQLKMSLPGGPLSLIDVAASGNTVIAYGWTSDAKGRVVRDGVWRSADGGRSWKPVEIPHPKGSAGPGIAITATPSGFVAGRNASSKSERYGVVLSSPDGVRWAPSGEIHLPGYGGLQRLAGTDRGLAAVIGGDKKVLLARSADGRTWQNAGEVPVPSGRSVEGVAVTAGATVVAARDDDGQEADAVLAVRDTLGQEIPVAPSRIAGAVTPDRTVTSVAAGRAAAVAVGSTNGDAAVWTSPDGDRWTRGRDTGQALARPGEQRLVSVASGGAGWLAVGTDGNRPLVVTSNDGAAWQAAGGGEFTPGRDGHVSTYSAAAGPSGYVVVGESGYSAGTWYSRDLKTWKLSDGGDLTGTKAANRWMRGVVAAASGYVAVGGLSDSSVKDAPRGRPAVWTSPDGATWSLRQLTPPAGAQEGWFDKVAVKGGVLVASGTVTTNSGRSAFAYTSSDGGATWQEVQLPPAGPADAETVVTALTATPKGFVLAGTTGSSGREDVALWTSADGRSWTALTPHGTGLSGRGDQWLTSMTALGGDLLAVGVTADHRGEQPTLWQRPLP